MQWTSREKRVSVLPNTSLICQKAICFHINVVFSWKTCIQYSCGNYTNSPNLKSEMLSHQSLPELALLSLWCQVFLEIQPGSTHTPAVTELSRFRMIMCWMASRGPALSGDVKCVVGTLVWRNLNPLNREAAPPEEVIHTAFLESLLEDCKNKTSAQKK